MIADRLAAKYATHPDFEDLRQEARLAELKGGGVARIDGAMKDALRKSGVVPRPRKTDAEGNRYMETVSIETIEEISSEPAVPECSKPPRLRRITPKQIEALRHIASGLSRKQTAFAMGISTRTLDTHMVSLYRRLGARNGAAAIIEGFRRGILSQENTASDLGGRLADVERKVLRLRADLSTLRRERRS